MPSMEAMLITLAGRSGEAAAARAPCRAWVRKNGDFRLRFRTLSQPLSGKSSNAAPQAAPALLTRMSRVGSRAATRAARALQPSTVETSWGTEMQVPPSLERAAAVASHGSALRAEI